MLAQSGNTIAIYDERAGAGSAVNATLSGYVLIYSGGRYLVSPSTTSMSASYNMTLNQAGTSYTGSATIICNDPLTPCWLGVSVTGSKI